MQIIYATDGSPSALAGATFLSKLPLDATSTIRLLAVAYEDQDSEEVVPALKAACRTLRASGAALEQNVRNGYPAEEIMHAADEKPTDLIVVGTKGQSAIARFFLGSVAEWVARHARQSVLVARPLHGDLDMVVIGVDGSAGSDEAMRLVATLPLPLACQIHLVSVVFPTAAVESARHMLLPKLSNEVAALAHKERADAERRLQDGAAFLATTGRRVSTELLTGNAAPELIAVAEEVNADLLVVGAQGLSALDRFLIGSVSEKVLRHAPCSVLCVRPSIIRRSADTTVEQPPYNQTS